jgi:hypothetical protein
MHLFWYNIWLFHVKLLDIGLIDELFLFF